METIIGSDMEMSSLPTGIVPILFSFCKSIVFSFKINNISIVPHPPCRVNPTKRRNAAAFAPHFRQRKLFLHPLDKIRNRIYN